MSKGLEALERLYCAGRLDLSYVASDKHKQDYDLIEKELKGYEGAKNHIEALHKERVENSLKLKALEIINKLGIKLVIPDNDYSKEHIIIEIYRQHFTKEEWEMIKKELDL